MKKQKTIISPSEVDRISDLPEEIIHLILASFRCQKQAARTSILSRRWLRLWSTYPVVEFQDYRYGKLLDFRFRSFLAATSKRLQLAEAAPFLLDSFTISAQRSINFDKEFHQLLSSASIGVEGDGGRSPLKVVVKYYTGTHLDLSEGGMFLNCRRTRILDLTGFDITLLHSFRTCQLDNLQELSLCWVQVSEESFPSCLANARRLERLSLKYIRGIETLDISASNFPTLKSLFFSGAFYNEGPGELQNIKLSSAPLLETLSFQYKVQVSVVTSSSAPNVKFIDFNPWGTQLMTGFDDFISKLPSLESLCFKSFFSLSRGVLRISARRLLNLTVKHSNSGIEFEIDAPNLVTLTIKTETKLHPIRLNVVNVAPSCRCLVYCLTTSYDITTSWFIGWRQCLESLTGAATRFHHLDFEIHFRLSQKSDLDLSQVGSESPPLTFPHLLLGTNLLLRAADTEKQADRTLLLNALLSTFHPKMLSVVRRRHSQHKKSLFSTGNRPGGEEVARKKMMKKQKTIISPSEVDRISDLPEEIIHLILASLPSHKEAARTSILSRRWLSFWRTYPVVEFSGICKEFQSFAAATSKRLLAAPALVLDTFNVTLIRRRFRRENDPDTQNWLRYGELLLSSLCSRTSPLKVVFKNNVNHLHTADTASLDARVLMFFNCGRTKFVELERFNLCGLHDSKMENLQELSLKHVVVSQQSFPSCLANAPRLEKLSLKYIVGIGSLDISASNFPSLKSLNFDAYAQIDYLKSLHISSAPLLETLCFVGKCKLLKVVSAPCVKSVKLSPVGVLSRIMLEELISKFPSLESLYFNASDIKRYNSKLKISSDNSKLRISSGTLRELTFVPRSKMKFEIDAPSLETLTIYTRLKINSTAVKVPPTCRCVLHYAFYGGRITTRWLTVLKKRLAAFATPFRCLVFKLDISHLSKVSKLNMSWIGCESTPLMVKHLLMAIDLPLERPLRDWPSTFKEAHRTRLLDGFLSTLRPKAITVLQSRSDRSLFLFGIDAQ
ncbi:Putative F-box/LRR-repeat protein At5g02930, partial [Linum grandiflorum]